MKSARRIAAIAALLAIFPLNQELRAEEPKLAALLKEGDFIEPREGPVRSALGYEAVTTTLSPDEEDSEGSLTTIILKGDQFVARIKHAKPVMFSPKGDILLLVDAAPDDDCRHFLLNVAGGEKAPEFDARHRIGDRNSGNPRWSKDGKLIQFFSLPDPFQDAVVETIVVAEHLAKNRQPEKSVKGVEQKVLHQQLETAVDELGKARAALDAAKTPEEKAAAQLNLEKHQQWKLELENRMESADPNARKDAWIASTSSAQSLVNGDAPDKTAAERALALTDKAIADANGEAAANTIALMIRSRCLFILDRKQEAIQAARQAIEADPGNGKDLTAHLHGILADYQAGKLPKIDPSTELREIAVPEE